MFFFFFFWGGGGGGGGNGWYERNENLVFNTDPYFKS